ncbi:MAG: hypothetical protein E7610_10360 [Ruminococcaceae bacterium]|nr:hypothetical protein [Oscillospiraceae bacterium]
MENRNQEPNRTPRNTRRESRRATRRLVTCALLCSLATVALGMGALIEILDLTAAAVSALILFPVLLCYGGKYALLSYAVTGILGVVLMPQSMAAWMFLGLTGYYPLIKNKLDRLPRILAWISKLALLTVVMMGYLALFHFVVLGGEGSFVDSFLAGFGEAEGGAVMAWAVVGLSVFSYVLFDLLIDRLLILYYLRWQKRLEKWMGK